jgi:hypothetical protein
MMILILLVSMGLMGMMIKTLCSYLISQLFGLVNMVISLKNNA